MASQSNHIRKLPISSTGRPAPEPLALLAPKLRPPRLHASLIERERLLAQLDSSLEGKLTLLSAPTGFGKTTLVRQWLARLERGDRSDGQQQTTAWVSLDASDNDAIRFWHYVISACRAWQTPVPAGQSALALLQQAQRSPFLSLDTVLTTFLNELNQLSSSGILVLEDYHVINSPQIHESVSFLLEHLPATLHIIMITRTDPPLPLARLRAHNDLHELRAADLRFSLEETRTFLQQVISFELTPQLISHLDTSMEGWATGLRLVTLALQRRMSQQEAEHFLATFSGSQPHLLEFFVTEILDVQPAPIQSFLLKTCILDRLSGPLCEAVTGEKKSDQLLATMERDNLFLQSLEGSGYWYRYHPLFAEAMQHEARQRLGEQALRICYEKASMWYEQQGMFTEAIEAALKAEAFARVAILVERIIKPHYQTEMHELRTLRRWLSALPEEVLELHPQLCLRFVMLLLFSRHGQEPAGRKKMDHLLHMAERFWQAGEHFDELGKIYAARALVVGERGDIIEAARLARQALTWLPEGEPQWRGACLRFLGTEALLYGRLHDAQQMFVETVTLYKAAGNSYATCAALTRLGQVYMLQGELHLAAEVYREVLTMAGRDISDRGNALLGLARLSYEWNALEQAEQEAQEALAIGERTADEMLQVHAPLVLADLQQARGESEQARHRLHTLLARTHSQSSPWLYREILARQARLALASGNLVAVERWSTMRTVQGETVAGETISRLQLEQEELLFARMLIAQGKAEEALRLLAMWQEEARQYGRVRSEIEIAILTALAYAAQEQQPPALQRLQEALTLAHAEGYQRLFLDEGEEIASLLRAMSSTIGKNPLRAYVRTLLLAFTQQQSGQPLPASIVASLIEPLSPQEQRVLRMLVAGYSNPEIAEALVVSPNTVKTQVRSIYRKLNVSSRQEARKLIREQGLL
ncbi:MAG: transcriptional regulator [Ktedonobacteraceae bacterium]|nr:transcriptional regulator [Ktedonobacteraceae bacterium]